MTLVEESDTTKTIANNGLIVDFAELKYSNLKRNLLCQKKVFDKCKHKVGLEKNHTCWLAVFKKMNMACMIKHNYISNATHS